MAHFLWGLHWWATFSVLLSFPWLPPSPTSPTGHVSISSIHNYGGIRFARFCAWHGNAVVNNASDWNKRLPSPCKGLRISPWPHRVWDAVVVGWEQAELSLLVMILWRHLLAIYKHMDTVMCKYTQRKWLLVLKQRGRSTEVGTRCETYTLANRQAYMKTQKHNRIWKFKIVHSTVSLVGVQ